MMTFEATPCAPGNRQRSHLDYPLSNEAAFRPNATGLWTFSLRAVGSIRVIAEGQARVDCLDSDAEIPVTLRAPAR